MSKPPHSREPWPQSPPPGLFPERPPGAPAPPREPAPAPPRDEVPPPPEVPPAFASAEPEDPRDSDGLKRSPHSGRFQIALGGLLAVAVLAVIAFVVVATGAGTGGL